MTLDKNKVLVGMSGGVDSCTAATLLVEQGYDVIGITIKTYKYEDVGGNVGNDSSCCSLDGINDARRVALQLGIPHYVVDFTENFKDKVINYFIDEYISGNTPNPCVQCNRHIKWSQLLKKADTLGAYYIATGHYARLQQDKTSGRFILSRGNDGIKDQSYALWGLTQESLARTMFPLANMTKEESRQIAEQSGLPIARKRESYEICYIPDNNYSRFLRDNVNDLDETVNGGQILLDGKVIGKHSGYPFYTIGQRKGLGISHEEPLYVIDVLPTTNQLIVGTEDKLSHSYARANDVNLIKVSELTLPTELLVKIRYKDDGALAMCNIDTDGILHVHFNEPRKAITPGQSLVMYDGRDIVGGGVITYRE